MSIRSSTLCVFLYASAAFGQIYRPSGSPDSTTGDQISTTEVQVLSTIHEPDQLPIWVTTLQHFSTWSHGSNSFFLDVSGGQNLDFYKSQTGLYLEYAPVFNLTGWILPTPSKGSAIKSIGLSPQLNYGRTPSGEDINRVFLEGPDVLWNVPKFEVFETQFLARQELNFQPSWQFTWVYTIPLRVKKADFLIWGFMDIWRRVGIPERGTQSGKVLLAQPQFLYDLGSGSHKLKGLYVGFELEPSHDYPISQVHKGWNFAWSPMIRWVFSDKHE
jgi:hypothetical protein